MVSAAGGEAAGDGVEVEREHRLQVVPVDLHRPAPHLPLFLFFAGGRGKECCRRRRKVRGGRRGWAGAGAGLAAGVLDLDLDR